MQAETYRHAQWQDHHGVGHERGTRQHPEPVAEVHDFESSAVQSPRRVPSSSPADEPDGPRVSALRASLVQPGRRLIFPLDIENDARWPGMRGAQRRGQWRRGRLHEDDVHRVAASRRGIDVRCPARLPPESAIGRDLRQAGASVLTQRSGVTWAPVRLSAATFPATNRAAEVDCVIRVAQRVGSAMSTNARITSGGRFDRPRDGRSTDRVAGRLSLQFEGPRIHSGRLYRLIRPVSPLSTDGYGGPRRGHVHRTTVRNSQLGCRPYWEHCTGCNGEPADDDDEWKGEESMPEGEDVRVLSTGSDGLAGTDCALPRMSIWSVADSFHAWRERGQAD